MDQAKKCLQGLMQSQVTTKGVMDLSNTEAEQAQLMEAAPEQ